MQKKEQTSLCISWPPGSISITARHPDLPWYMLWCVFQLRRSDFKWKPHNKGAGPWGFSPAPMPAWQVDAVALIQGCLVQEVAACLHSILGSLGGLSWSLGWRHVFHTGISCVSWSLLLFFFLINHLKITWFLWCACVSFCNCRNNSVIVETLKSAERESGNTHTRTHTCTHTPYSLLHICFIQFSCL